MNFIPLIFGLVMGVVHYLSERIRLKFKKQENKVISFSAGVAITYIFLELFPKFSEGVAEISRFLFLSILLGFVILHIVEKYLYQHDLDRKKLKQDLALVGAIVSFTYHFIIGMIAVNLITRGLEKGFLLFIPVLLYTAVDTMPVWTPKQKVGKLVLASSTILGVLFASFGHISTTMNYIFLGFIIGVLSYSSTRHSIPAGKRGKPFWFFIGAVFYSLIIIMSWVL